MFRYSELSVAKQSIQIQENPRSVHCFPPPNRVFRDRATRPILMTYINGVGVNSNKLVDCDGRFCCAVLCTCTVPYIPSTPRNPLENPSSLQTFGCVSLSYNTFYTIADLSLRPPFLLASLSSVICQSLFTRAVFYTTARKAKRNRFTIRSTPHPFEIS
jgi:hypothetical protein